MKQTCFRWIFAPSGDYLGLRRRLNRLAEDGWELDETGDKTCFLAQFRHTERTELRYDVEVAPLLRDAGQLEETVERRRQGGWEPVGTINGVDVYRSMPCQSPQEESEPVKNRSCWVVRALLFLLFVGTAAALSWGGRLFDEEWYLSNLGILLNGGRFPLLAGGVFWAVWVVGRLIFPPKKPPHPVFLWCRTVLLVGFLLWIAFLPVCLVLDWLPLGWDCALLLLALAVGIFGQSRWKRRAGQASRSFAALVLGCTLVAAQLYQFACPDGTRYSAGSAPWRHDLPEVVRAEELGQDGMEFRSAEYSRTGSLLVQKSAYWEEWEGFTLKSECYTCLTPGLAAMVEEQQRVKHPDCCIVAEGRQVMTLWVSEELPMQELEALLLEKMT